jgi:hypothetical protein
MAVKAGKQNLNWRTNMRRSHRASLNFWSAETFLGKRDSKKLCNNTLLHRIDQDTLAVKLWSTNVITFYRNGNVMLNSGGWETVTTRDRMNSFSGLHVSFSQKGHSVNGCYRYQDGITFNGEDCLNGSYIIREALIKLLGKPIVNTPKAVEDCIAGLTVKEMELVWKKCKRDHRILAKFCSKDFLLLCINVTEVSDILEERLVV